MCCTKDKWQLLFLKCWSTSTDKWNPKGYQKGKQPQWAAFSAGLAHAMAAPGFAEQQHCWSGSRAVVLLGWGWRPDVSARPLLKCRAEKDCRIIWQVRAYLWRSYSFSHGPFTSSCYLPPLQDSLETAPSMIHTSYHCTFMSNSGSFGQFFIQQQNSIAF